MDKKIYVAKYRGITMYFGSRKKAEQHIACALGFKVEYERRKYSTSIWNNEEEGTVTQENLH